MHSLADAIALVDDNETAFIIGGGEIYKQSMDRATDIELTRVHGSFEADAFFPEIDTDQWELVKEEHHPKDDRHQYSFTYLTYKRK